MEYSLIWHVLAEGLKRLGFRHSEVPATVTQIEDMLLHDKEMIAVVDVDDRHTAEFSEKHGGSLAKYRDHQEMLAQLGLVVDRGGPEELVIREVPAILSDADGE